MRLKSDYNFFAIFCFSFKFLSDFFCGESQRCAGTSKTGQKNKQEGKKHKLNKAKRVFSIGQLNALLHLHLQPIKHVVYMHP